MEAFGILAPNNQFRVIYPDIPDNYRTRLDLQWPIYTGGRLDALERAARIDATASADEILAARGDLTLEITRAYWALVTATEALRGFNRYALGHPRLHATILPIGDGLLLASVRP